MGPSLLFGVLAAFTGQTLAYPLEAVSRRLQVSRLLCVSICTVSICTVPIALFEALLIALGAMGAIGGRRGSSRC